jgi:hypothetical protein
VEPANAAGSDGTHPVDVPLPALPQLLDELAGPDEVNRRRRVHEAIRALGGAQPNDAGGETGTDRGGGDRTPIRIGGEAATIRTLTEHIGYDALLPDVYVTNGALVHLTRISGDTDTTPPGDDPPPGRYWPQLRPLYGIVGSPVLRPDAFRTSAPTLSSHHPAIPPAHTCGEPWPSPPPTRSHIAPL